ncbi:MAG: DUF3999 family protein [Gemmataceae bacterium]
MTFPRIVFVGVSLLCLIPNISVSQEKSDAGSEESLRHWKYFHTITAGADAQGKYHSFFLPPAVFGPARSNLSDLRLYDAGGKEVPYALRVLEPVTQREPISAKVYDQVTKSDGSATMSLDLGKERGEHNQIQVDLAGVNYRRPFQLEGSNKEGSWRTVLANKYLIDYQYDDQRMHLNRFQYPNSRFRYLRLTVSLDPSEDDQKKQAKNAKLIRKVKVFRFVDVPGQRLTHTAVLDVRQAVPTGRGPGSAWYITFDGNKPPVEKLLFYTSSIDFVRPYRLEGVTGSGKSQTLVSGEWRRGESSDLPLVIRVPEGSYRKYRLVVTDQRNTPLELDRATYTMWARQIIFELPNEVKLPLRLYYGNPNANPPGYDFAARLPKELPEQPARVSVDFREENPIYQPEPEAWTERYSWLIYLVLGVVNLVLFGIVVSLGKLAISRHDAAKNPETQSEESSTPV